VTSVTFARRFGHGLWALLLGVALCTTPMAQADESESDWDLRVFAQEPRAQRNRVLAEDLPEAVAARLLAIVAQGVRGCDCLPRRLRWVWALPRPSDRIHPALVVSFDDRPREHASILMYERMALLTYRDGKYGAQGVLSLNRPLANVDGALSVSMLPRRDFDQDGQLDIGVRFMETWKRVPECGRVLFQSGSVAPVFEPTSCSEQAAAD